MTNREMERVIEEKTRQEQRGANETTSYITLVAKFFPIFVSLRSQDLKLEIT